MTFLSVNGSAFQCTCKCNLIELIVLRHPQVEDPRDKSAAYLVSVIYPESSTCCFFSFSQLFYNFMLSINPDGQSSRHFASMPITCTHAGTNDLSFGIIFLIISE